MNYYYFQLQSSFGLFIFDDSEGFIVEGNKTSDFLEESLKKMGLKDSEINEFIVFWLPYMEDQQYNFIRFEFEKNE